MSLKQSVAAKKRSLLVPKEVRSERMRKIALIKHEKMTPAERRAQGIKMRSGRTNI